MVWVSLVIFTSGVCFADAVVPPLRAFEN